MRTWHCGAWMFVMLAGCGGGDKATTSSTGATAQSSGAEMRLVDVQRTQVTPRQQEIVEVWEARIPTSAPAGAGMARGTPAPTTGGAAPSAGAEEMELSETITPSGEVTEEELLTAAPGSTPAERESLEIAINEICPTDIPTLRARARNVERGAALVLTARGEENVDRLRDRMRQFALVHSAEHARQCEVEPQEGVTVGAETAQSRLADPASPLMAAHDLRLVEIPNGVRVELRYDDAEGSRAEVRELRTRVREDVATLRDGICPLAFQAA